MYENSFVNKIHDMILRKPTENKRNLVVEVSISLNHFKQVLLWHSGSNMSTTKFFICFFITNNFWMVLRANYLFHFISEKHSKVETIKRLSLLALWVLRWNLKADSRQLLLHSKWMFFTKKYSLIKRNISMKRTVFFFFCTNGVRFREIPLYFLVYVW